MAPPLCAHALGHRVDSQLVQHVVDAGLEVIGKLAGLLNGLSRGDVPDLDVLAGLIALDLAAQVHDVVRHGHGPHLFEVLLGSLTHPALAHDVGQVVIAVIFRVRGGGIDVERRTGVLLGEVRCSLGQGVVIARGEANVDAVGTEELAHLALYQHGDEFHKLGVGGVLGDDLVQLRIDVSTGISVTVLGV